MSIRSDVSISRRKKGSRAGEEIISSKHSEWLFDLFVIFCLVGTKRIHIYKCQSWHVVFSCPWFSLSVGGSNSEPWGEIWLWEVTRFTPFLGLETTWESVIPHDVWRGWIELSAKMGFLARNLPRMWKINRCWLLFIQQLNGETHQKTFHHWIQLLQPAWNWNQSQLREENLSPFSRSTQSWFWEEIWDICQTSTYLAVLSKAAMAFAQHLLSRANFVQTFCKEHRGIGGGQLMGSSLGWLLLIQSNWMTYEMWMLA